MGLGRYNDELKIMINEINSELYLKVFVFYTRRLLSA